MFRNLILKAVYRSETDSLLEDFYLPVFRESSRYDRAVGFFSASMLSYAAQGVSALAERGGRMRLIFGGEVDEQDASAIEKGYVQRAFVEMLGIEYLAVIDNISDALVLRRLETLSWLIAANLLDIKVALKPRGMYHEKIGIFYDSVDDRVVFQGSANETVYALLQEYNFESINVFRSWEPSHQEYAQPYIDGFERLWRNESIRTLVIPFPEAARERLLTIGKRSGMPSSEAEMRVIDRMRKRSSETLAGTPSIPTIRDGEPFQLRDHQLKALNAWKARDFRGVLAMATGAGKTVIALYGMVKLYEALSNLFVIIAVPYQSLADQWMAELRNFGVLAISCYGSRREWEDDLRFAVAHYTAGALNYAACVVVYKTMQSTEFQDVIRTVQGQRMFVVGDECHNFGSESLNKALPSQAGLRMGLSATPRHYLDAARTARVVDYFGEVAFEYSLSQALKDKVLTPYRYYVHLVELTEDESEEYLELSADISRLAASESIDALEDSDETALNLLLFKRARLLGNAADKVTRLTELLSGRRPEPFTLFYCGDGESDDGVGPTRQIDQVSRLLYGAGWRVAQFTSRQSRAERMEILEKFRIGAIDALIAIRCLDEGIDVPACRTAYILASARNPKQFVQRRGRILRRSPGKTEAVVHDFMPCLWRTDKEATDVERRLIEAELERVAEFAGLSTNIHEAFKSLRPLLEKYDLHHILAANLNQ